MRPRTIIGVAALALAGAPATAQNAPMPSARNANDGGILAAPAEAQYNGNGAVVAAPEAGGSSCAARYRSFDPATGTYMGRDGRRHTCQ